MRSIMHVQDTVPTVHLFEVRKVSDFKEIVRSNVFLLIVDVCTVRTKDKYRVVHCLSIKTIIKLNE